MAETVSTRIPPSPAEAPPVAEQTSFGINPGFTRKLEVACRRVRCVAYLSILGGTFSLMFTLLFAATRQGAILNLAHISFLCAGAVSFAIGMGLLNFSDAARGAGSMWFLAWGVMNLVVGFSAAWQGNLMIGALCMSGGAILIIFADLLHLPAEVFVCAYTNGDLCPREIEEGILKGHSDTEHPAMAEFVKRAYQ